jgi:hypothetical protein
VGNGKNMKILKSKQMLQYPYVEWEFVDALEQRLYSKQCRVVPEKVKSDLGKTIFNNWK